MVNLSFKNSPKSLTYNDIVNLSSDKGLKVPVIIANDGLIYIGKPSSGCFQEFFTNLPYNYKEGDEIYFFVNSAQISKTLQESRCLDKFLWKKPTAKVNRLPQIKEWISTYKFVGAISTELGSPQKRLLTTVDNNTIVRSHNKDGRLSNYDMRGEEEYSNFVGSNDQFEFFKWLNT